MANDLTTDETKEPKRKRASKRPRAEQLTAKKLLDALLPDHEWQHDCPVCGKDCSRIALVKLIYRFETCSCDAAPYTHLIERLYHEQCFCPAPDPMTTERSKR